MSDSPKKTASMDENEGGFVCLVDGDGEYSFNEEKLKTLITHVDPRGTQDYSIVGIMGCQSTGKSTLLNHLFGTKFQMMEASTGRSQTTKGIWLDAARNTENLVVMDLEGTDSGERGEDRTTFERQTILYGLALCEVLIVNMWYTDIGRYTASNYGIMKTVFEVNLQLFKAQGKTMLLFIVRDYIAAQTPFSALEAKLKGEMERIWAELRKPDEYADARMEDFFDFRFEALPHYVLQRPQFDEDADLLRQRFTDDREDSFLATPYHGNKSVPAEGFAQYSESVWGTIRSNQDLNLPSQRELLATFRCDQAIASMMDRFQDERFAALQEAAGRAPDAELGVKVGAHLQAVVDEFDAETGKYAPTVVSRKRGELRKKLLLQCEAPLSTQIEAFLVPGCTTQFQRDLAFAVGGGELCPDLYITTARLRAAAMDSFSAQCARLCAGLADEVASPTAEQREAAQEGGAAPVAEETLAQRLSRRHAQQLERQLDALTEAARKAQLHVLSAVAAADMLSRLAEPVSALFKEAPADLWAKLGAVFVKELAAVAQHHEPVLDQLVNDDAERAVVLRELVLHAEAALREQAQQQAQVCPLKMKAIFDLQFSRHEGSRRVWGAKDQPRLLFTAAKDAALSLLPLLSSFRLRAHWGAAGALAEQEGKDGEAATTAPALSRQGTTGANAVDEEGFPQMLSPAQAAAFKQDFLVDVEGALHDALRERERNMAQNRVPAWAIVMMLVLGYNEIVAILSNPLFLVLAVLLAVAAFVVHQLGMWGPVTSIAKSTLDQVMTHLNGAMHATHEEDTPAPKQMRKLSINPTINLDTLPSAPSSMRNMDREGEVTQRRKED